ncbi:SIMPL domain-containing protein [Reichenbachiella versicolor]|uniref:SIMPL domain-containing protein n=1 Tax=Reichenbachiella versicolor TaxID=1821036 RepID=UPI000D6E991D|nr:SIMPL domain-containing protein [Reichenbachiella versicolor]
MKKLFILSSFILLCQISFAQTKNFIDQPFIETSAMVDTLVTPDEIYLTISITEKDTKGKVSVEELESKMVTVLKKMGIKTKENLTLNDLSSNFKKYFLKNQDILKVKVYTLKVFDAITAGKVILELEKNEISNVTLERTEYSKIKALKLQLKSKAILKAKRQAEYLAHPLGQKVGTAILISDDPNNSFVNQYQDRSQQIMIRGYSSMNRNEFKPADIEFKKIKVQAAVSVKFKLEE